MHIPPQIEKRYSNKDLYTIFIALFITEKSSSADEWIKKMCCNHHHTREHYSVIKQIKY